MLDEFARRPASFLLSDRALGLKEVGGVIFLSGGLLHKNFLHGRDESVSAGAPAHGHLERRARSERSHLQQHRHRRPGCLSPDFSDRWRRDAGVRSFEICIRCLRSATSPFRSESLTLGLYTQPSDRNYSACLSLVRQSRWNGAELTKSKSSERSIPWDS